MKKNFTVNISNRLFQIDEDAYNMLQNYINAIHNKLKYQQCGEETANDIEERIAEILNEVKTPGNGIVTIDNVREVIRRVGSPEQLCGESTATSDERVEGTFTGDEYNTTQEDNTHSYQQESSDYLFSNLKGKRFYRNPNDKIIAGVMSGLARYFGGDVTLWRLAAVVFSLIFIGTGLIAYLALALIIPEDPELKKNPSQEGVKSANDPAPVVKHGCMATFFKFAFIIILILVLASFISSILTFFGFLTLPFFSEPLDLGDGVTLHVYSGVRNTIRLISFVLLVGIPIYMHQQNKKARLGSIPPMTSKKKNILIIIWICMLFTFLFTPKINYNFQRNHFISPKITITQQDSSNPAPSSDNTAEDELDKVEDEFDKAEKQIDEATQQIDKAQADIDNATIE